MRAWAMVGCEHIGSGDLLFAPSASQRSNRKPARPRRRSTPCLLAAALTDSAERLACYDKAAAGDRRSGRQAATLVVFDRESVRKTKRGLFGFSIPNLGIFGDDDNEVEIKQVDGEIASTAFNADGGYIFRLADGSRWSQMDGKPIALATGKRGQGGGQERRAWELYS